MKVKLLLIIAVTAATLFFVMGTIKQAHAYNMLLSFGAKNVENIVKMAKKEDEIVLEGTESAQIDEKQEGDLAKIEPAAG